MKYEKIIEKIAESQLSRLELIDLRKNALDKLAKGDQIAQAVIDAIDAATPKDNRFIFMGFCPGADFSGRLDIEWKSKGICEFEFTDSLHQLERFNDILKGDMIILKKREKFGQTMKLFGHGRVISTEINPKNQRYLNVNWSEQNSIIEVPLMACNSTVDVRTIDVVENEMPPEFWKWLA